MQDAALHPYGGVCLALLDVADFRAPVQAKFAPASSLRRPRTAASGNRKAGLLSWEGGSL